MRAHAVYLYFNKQNQLLYIGTSQVLATRVYAHERNSAWITQASQIRIIWYKTRAQAYAAEQRAILRYKPPYNKSTDDIKCIAKNALLLHHARAQVWRDNHQPYKYK